jgi:hypothetical protein
MCYFRSENLLKEEVLDFHSIIVTQWVILAWTAIYAIIVKWQPSKSSSKPGEPCNLPPSISTTTPPQGNTNEPDR